MQLSFEELLGSSIQQLSLSRINNGDGIEVYRISYQQEGLTQSSVVKHRPDFINVDDRRYFAFEFEKQVYKVLSEQSEFDRYPKLLRISSDTILLQDLGYDEFEFYNVQGLMNAIASTFAMLHGATMKRPALLQGLIDLQSDNKVEKRKYSNSQCTWFFQSGRNLVASIASKLELDCKKYLNIMAEIQHEIDHPEEFHALIHGDILSRRQSVSPKGVFHLLDFEEARISHALLDLATTLIGKFEKRNCGKIYFLNYQEFDCVFLCRYREQLAEQYDIYFTDDKWQQAIASALCYQTLVNVGVLMQIPHYYTGVVSLNRYFKCLLSRLTDFLRKLNVLEALQILLTNITKKIQD